MVLNSVAQTKLEDVSVLLLAAGFGTRLRPLTEQVPKPLIEVAGRSLIERHLEQLRAVGIRRVIVNLHHLGQQLVDALGDGSRWGVDICYSWEETLLDTAGALRPIREQWSAECLLVVNSDSLFLDPPPYAELLELHLSGRAAFLATMLLRADPEAERFGALELKCVPEAPSAGELSAFLERRSPRRWPAEVRTEKLMYPGICLLSRRIYDFLPEARICSLTRDVLAPALARGEAIAGLRYAGRWFDVGTPERLAEARAAAAEKNSSS